MTHQTLELRTADGVCPAHVCHPDGDGPWPGVLMFMDGIGMRPALVHMAERLAGTGAWVLLPDLFYRAGAYEAADAKKLVSDPAVRAAWFQKMMPAAGVEKTMRDT